MFSEWLVKFRSVFSHFRGIDFEIFSEGACFPTPLVRPPLPPHPRPHIHTHRLHISFRRPLKICLKTCCMYVPSATTEDEGSSCDDIIEQSSAVQPYLILNSYHTPNSYSTSQDWRCGISLKCKTKLVLLITIVV